MLHWIVVLVCIALNLITQQEQLVEKSITLPSHNREHSSIYNPLQCNIQWTDNTIYCGVVKV